mmetsp:Transcript_4219/g.10539  ORF Transcript_4219/g.10539 Transcript_4219/m.10539 type:complete len:207 (+) Transcript_4219:676-1296(+)
MKGTLSISTNSLVLRPHPAAWLHPHCSAKLAPSSREGCRSGLVCGPQPEGSCIATASRCQPQANAPQPQPLSNTHTLQLMHSVQRDAPYQRCSKGIKTLSPANTSSRAGAGCSSPTTTGSARSRTCPKQHKKINANKPHTSFASCCQPNAAFISTAPTTPETHATLRGGLTYRSRLHAPGPGTGEAQSGCAPRAIKPSTTGRRATP